MKNKSGDKQIATKKDIKKLASRSELKRVERSLRQEMLRIEGGVENIEVKVQEIAEGQKGLDAKLDRIEKTLDGFVGRVDDLTVENKFGTNQTRELRVQVNNHEERITKLESPAA